MELATTNEVTDDRSSVSSATYDLDAWLAANAPIKGKEASMDSLRKQLRMHARKVQFHKDRHDSIMSQLQGMVDELKLQYFH